MRKQLTFVLFIIIFFLPVQLLAQDFTGLWKGELFIDSTKQALPYEVSISESNGKLTAYSHMVYVDSVGRGQIDFRDLKVKRKADELILEDEESIENTFAKAPKFIRKTLTLDLKTTDSLLILKGTWETNRTKRFLSATGKVQLQRLNDYKKTALFKKLEERSLTNQLVFNERVPETVVPPTIANIDPDKQVIAVAVPVSKPVAIKPLSVKQANTIAPPKPEPVAVVEPPKEIPKPVPPPVVVKPTPPPPVVVVEKKPAPIAKPVPPPAPVEKPKPVVVAAPPKPAPVAVVAKPAPQPVAVSKPAPPVAKPTPPPAPVEKPVVVAPPVVKKPQPVTDFSQANVVAGVDVNKRVNSSNQSVFYKSDSLVITLYDNGDIDGDTVTVFLNGKVFIAKKGLDVKPNGKAIYINEDTPDSLMLVMYAENLGSIPPNTGLLVVHDGDAVYEVRFSADLNHNAAILLRRKKQGE